MKKFFLVLLLLAGICSTAFAAPDTVYRVKINGTIDLGLAHYVSRAIAEANARGGKAILLEINTFGGRVDAGTQIRDAIYGSSIPVTAYVDTRAWSAGALIALACPRILMSPGSSIGAAEPIPSTAKNISALEGEFKSEAERYNRSPIIAAAMVDPDLDSPGLKKKGEILTLTAVEAVNDGYAQKIANNEADALADLGTAKADVAEISYTPAENFARFVTDPDVGTLLLVLGLLGIAVEVITQHGLAGAVGLLSLGLFFGGHMIADLSDTWFLLLFVAGVGLLLVELHVLPGHGVSGLAGIVAILASLFLALGGNAMAGKQLSLSLAIALVAFLVLLRYLPKAPLFSRLILRANSETPPPTRSEIPAEKNELKDLVGKLGKAVSELRPSGIVLIDNRRYSAMTDGQFIPQGTEIRVAGLQGGSLLVHQENPVSKA